MEDIIRNYRRVDGPQSRLGLLVQSSINAAIDPERADLVALSGELSSQRALKAIHSKMLQSETGKKILEERPRVNSSTWNLERMIELDKKSFGHQYAAWMLGNQFDSNDRPIVRLFKTSNLPT